MLISHSSLFLFVTGAAVLLVIPGPAVTYVVSRSIGHGRAAGLVSVLGIVVGTLCHVVAAALGISAVLASSALAFRFVKYLGAAYLIYLGIKTLRTPDQQLFASAGGETRLARIFGQGFLVNLLIPTDNPSPQAVPGSLGVNELVILVLLAQDTRRHQASVGGSRFMPARPFGRDDGAVALDGQGLPAH